METLKSYYPCSLIKIFIVLFFFSMASCQEFVQDEIVPDNDVSNEETVQWNDLLLQLDLRSTIIVQKDESIQDAVDVALPGDVIYIEPGIYEESLTIDKSDIKLVGLGNSHDNQVILNNPVTGENAEIINVQSKYFEFNSMDISTLSSARVAGRRCILNMDRTELGGGIAHYRFEVAMGKGEFDVVRIHRVVRERRPYRPVRTKGDIFMIHGAVQDFNGIFLTAGAEVINAKTSSPFYLASGNIDVWGIDMGWTMVPIETEDFSFMEGWGIKKDVDHALKAMSIARIIRGLTGQGFSRMNLFGFSYGVYVAYGAAGRETRQHWIRRDVKGLIPVDGYLKYDPDDPKYIALTDSDCARADDAKVELDAGVYQSDMGAGLIFMGGLALNLPNDGSDIIPGFTNSQALMFAGSFPDPISDWHFFGGDFNAFIYTDPQRFFRLAANLSPYMPLQIFYEMDAFSCNGNFDMYHLSEISVPIFYLGAGGGTGTRGDYTSSLTASNDLTNYTVSLDNNPAIDFGHGDLWLGEDADELVWEKIRHWLVEHNGHAIL